MEDDTLTQSHDASWWGLNPPARLVIKGAESCERRWGNHPGNLPVGVAPVGLVGVVAGASVDSMGLLPPQQGAVQRLVFPSRYLEITFRLRAPF
jgi:hypothetical protein